jgi:predicted nucleotidyltransferase
MSTWFKKSMPRVKQVKPILLDLAQRVKSIASVDSVLLWGSMAKFAEKPNFVVRDIDLIAVTQLFSEDLLSITDDALKMASSELEEQGFDAKSVLFTRQFIAMKDFNIDHWLISSDKKLLHWGALLDSREEWDELRSDAEDYAKFMTGYGRGKLKSASQDMRDRWSLMYQHHVNKEIAGIPSGWYQADVDIDAVMGEMKTLC